MSSPSAPPPSSQPSSQPSSAQPPSSQPPSTEPSGAASATKLGTYLLVAAAATAVGAWWAMRPPSGAPSSSSAPGVAQSDTRAEGQPGASQAHTANAGQVVPDTFWTQTFDRPDGQTLNLAAYKGHPIVVNFWASWCPPCVKEMPDIDRFHQAMKDKGWKVVGLAVDGPTPVREFLAKVPVGFDIGLAGFGGTELAQLLGNTAGGLPFTVIIDAQGRIVHRKMGGTTLEELSRLAAAL